MNHRPYVLAIVALGLAGVMVLDYWPNPIRVAEVQTPVAPKLEALLNPLSQRENDDFHSLSDHPLFDPNRSPPVAAVAQKDALIASEISKFVEAAPVLSPKPVLMGTVTSPMPGGAYLGDDFGGPVVFLRPGQTSMGLTLKQVLDRSAFFEGPDGLLNLPLQESPVSDPDLAPDGMPALSTTLPSPG